MGLDLRLVILDVDRTLVVVDRWLGGRSAYEQLRERMARAPDTARAAEATWRVRPAEVVASTEAFCAGGPTASEVARWAESFDQGRFVWWITADW